MSDHEEQNEYPREDRAALDALEALSPGWASGVDPVEREYVELLGLLPYELEWVEPSASTRAAILTACEAETSGGARVVAFERPAVAEVQTPVAAGSRPWLMPLAAALALVSIGLAGGLGWMMGQLDEQRAALAQLENQIEEARLAEERLQLVTMKGTELCRLKPMGETPHQPQAHATFYRAPEKKGWVISADNLDPCDQGNRYMVWFMTEDGPVHGGTFFVKTAGKIEISSDAMPEGTGAIMITLESEDRTEPTGPTILYGNEALMTL